jgi:roadblock/LC7 domain-containing protein
VDADYPVRFSVAYPDRNLDRLTTGLRIFVAIPIFIVLASLGGYSGQFGGGQDATTIGVGGTGLLFLPPLLMLVFRQKYPRWWFDWNLELLRFTNRVGVYLALMTDRYPSTDEQQSVQLEFGYPDAKQHLNRWLPLVKWLLAIPHYIVLVFLYLGVIVAVVVAWFAILFTGRYPRGIFDYVEGVIRWHNRVVGYALILVTDRYPPFRLREPAAPAPGGPEVP